MPRFTAAPLEDVVPPPKRRHPSRRAQVEQQYQQALLDALAKLEALVVELEDGDQPVTIRNRLRRAGERLGIEQLSIRKRGTRIIAYRVREDEVPKVGTDDALGG